MEYTQVLCTLTPDNEINRQLLEAELGELGFESFQETETIVEAYIPSSLFTDSLLKNDGLVNHPLFSVEFKVQIIEDQNWNSVWEENEFKPICINDDVIIRSPNHADQPEFAFQIIINPNMSFGTGDHETTSMIVQQIQHQDVKGKAVLDMGCGTGVLGIFAAMKGAKSVHAIDIDEWSYEGTSINVKLNGVDSVVTPEHGDASALGSKTYDIVYANIHKNILLQDMEAYVQVMNSGAEIIFSGFYTSDIKDIYAKATSLGLTELDFKENNTWVAYRFQK